MKPVNPLLAADFAENLTSVCRIWTVERKDGLTHRFTDHDKDIPFEGDLYLSDNSFSASAIQTSVNSASSDLDIDVILSEGAIEYDDMLRGLYDDAPVTLRAVNYHNLLAGSLELFAGLIKTVVLPSRELAKLSLTGKVAMVLASFTERYSATCRARFGDGRCKVNLAAHTVAFTVSAVAGSQKFTSPQLAGHAVNLFQLGSVIWTTGRNKGTRVDVSSNTAGVVNLFFRPPYQIAVGDTGTIVRGCSKTVAACTAYGNLPNYRGEPYVPGDDGIGG